MMRVTGLFAKWHPSPLYAAATTLDTACEYLAYRAFLVMLERAEPPQGREEGMNNAGILLSSNSEGILRSAREKVF
jgi:hypothetical protein